MDLGSAVFSVVLVFGSVWNEGVKTGLIIFKTPLLKSVNNWSAECVWVEFCYFDFGRIA